MGKCIPKNKGQFQAEIRRVRPLLVCLMLVPPLGYAIHTLLIDTSASLPQSTFSLSEDIPHERSNWIVDTNLTVTNQTILLDGDLIVTGTGGLTLKGVTLVMNNSFEGQYKIEVRDGGYLNITDGSNVTSAHPEYEFMFWVQSGSH
ncbi:MAG: hypothetical protein ACE5KV_03170, partial [Thermoplasmata archaeon]